MLLVAQAVSLGISQPKRAMSGLQAQIFPLFNI
jgi:hypothetical protein